jgi:hypothetical protein
MELDLGLELISLTKIDNIEPYSHFKIGGVGDLCWMTNSNKNGYGCQVRHKSYKQINSKWVTLNRDFYFTENEINELFLESHIYYDKIYQRDIKINTILNEK